MSEYHFTASPPQGKPAKPSKPYPDFPLTPRLASYWCKRIRGKLHYFGSWDDPDGALAKYNEQKEDLRRADAAPRPRRRDGEATGQRLPQRQAAGG
jgi:hypothetical protein